MAASETHFERMLLQTMEVMHCISIGLTLATWDIWDSLVASAVPRLVFIIWEPPSLGYLKVNFDGSVRDSRGMRDL